MESVFSGSVDGAPAPQIGAWFVRQHGKWFVQNVFSGSSAQRSGKEWITDLLEKSKRATLIRERTKGYFLAGKLFKIIPGKYDLYLAVKKGSGPDLEGKGVKPDIEVPQNLE